MSETIPECEACRPDAPKLTAEEIAKYSKSLPQWQVKDVGGVTQLHRTYPFGNFAQALAFTNRVGELAEGIGHHPELVTEWGRTTVKWWSHKIKGLHELDFAMAKRCDSLVEG